MKPKLIKTVYINDSGILTAGVNVRDGQLEQILAHAQVMDAVKARRQGDTNLRVVSAYTLGLRKYYASGTRYKGDYGCLSAIYETNSDSINFILSNYMRQLDDERGDSVYVHAGTSLDLDTYDRHLRMARMFEWDNLAYVPPKVKLEVSHTTEVGIPTAA